MTDNLFRLLRVKHWIKNSLIFAPLFFSLSFSVDSIITAVLGFVLFSVTSSIVYIINDIHDIDDDRKHPTKQKRPIASGRISVKWAWGGVAMLAIIVALLSYIILHRHTASIASLFVLTIYVVINLAYSIRLKHVPIIDIFILAIGFILRVIFGAAILNIAPSDWLILTVLCASLFMGIGKRRNELSQSKKTRKVNRFYSINFLNSSLYAFMSLTICFYSLWAVNGTGHIQHAAYTIPLVILILMSYALKIENDKCDGDPVNVLLTDKNLIGLSLLYITLLLILVVVGGQIA